MRRCLVALVAVMLLAFSACTTTTGAEGTSSGSSSSNSNGSSSNGSSSGSSSNDGSSGSSSNDGSSGSSNNSGGNNGGNNNGNGNASSNDGTSGGSSSNDNSNSGSKSNDGTSGGSSSDGGSSGGSSNDNNGGNGNGDGTATIPGPTVTFPPVPDNFTLPKPNDGGDTVKVPDGPPDEVKHESALKRLSELPPVPRSCLDPDLSLLDIFIPGAAIPVRLTYCLLYVGTIARFPGEIRGGGSSSDESVSTAPVRTDTGDSIRVPLLQPRRTQRPLLTIALLLLIVAVAITIGYFVGQRRAEATLRIDQRARGE